MPEIWVAVSCLIQAGINLAQPVLSSVTPFLYSPDQLAWDGIFKSTQAIREHRLETSKDPNGSLAPELHRVTVRFWPGFSFLEFLMESGTFKSKEPESWVPLWLL